MSVRLAIVGLLTVSPLVACLPAGNPPTGRQLVPGREAARVQFADAPVGERARLLLSYRRPVADDPFGQNDVLYAVDDPPAGSAFASSRMLLDYVASFQAVAGRPDSTIPADSRGRLYLTRTTLTPSMPGAGGTPGGSDVHSELFRVDPATGEAVKLGATFSDVGVSSDRNRIVSRTVDADGRMPWLVTDVDDHQITVPVGTTALFVGNDLFFDSTDGHLMRLRPDDQIDTVAMDVSTFEPVDTTHGPMLVLRRMGRPASLFDVPGLVEIALPPRTAAAQQYFVSPSGRYVVSLTEPRDVNDLRTELAFFDRDIGMEMTAELPRGMSRLSVSWRPAHDEAWVLGEQIWAWKPNQPLTRVAVSDDIRPLSDDLFGRPLFTTDGRFWLGAAPSTTEKVPVFLLSADAPAIDFKLLNPLGTGFGAIWPLPDGRSLAETWVTDRKRCDISLVDSGTPISPPLVTTGSVVAVGRRWFLALLHWVPAGSSGDLTLIDLADGTQTLLAENVSSVAVEPSADADDPLSSGTRIAYFVRNRLASRYDGLWVATLQ